MVNIFQAKHGTIAYCSSAVTWDNNTSIAGESFTGNINEMKDITLTFPEMSVEQVPLLGNTAQSVGANTNSVSVATGPTATNFQNAMMDVKNATNWKISGTVVFQGDEEFFHILGLGAGTTTATSYTRYAVGNLTSTGTPSMTLDGCLRTFLNNGSEEATFLMTNAYVTKIGDLKPTGADGHWECDMEAECLPKDGALEFKN